MREVKTYGWVMWFLTIQIPFLWIFLFKNEHWTLMLPGVFLLIFHTALWWNFLKSELGENSE